VPRDLRSNWRAGASSPQRQREDASQNAPVGSVVTPAAAVALSTVTRTTLFMGDRFGS